jgi:hypothetical protein
MDPNARLHHGAFHDGQHEGRDVGGLGDTGVAHAPSTAARHAVSSSRCVCGRAHSRRRSQGEPSDGAAMPAAGGNETPTVALSRPKMRSMGFSCWSNAGFDLRIEQVLVNLEHRP